MFSFNFPVVFAQFVRTERIVFFICNIPFLNVSGKIPKLIPSGPPCRKMNLKRIIVYIFNNACNINEMLMRMLTGDDIFHKKSGAKRNQKISFYIRNPKSPINKLKS